MILVSGVGAYLAFSQQGCSPPVSSTPARYQAPKVQFGAVTEYCLASPSRWSNAITVGPDGSVWFGEEAVPGVGRLLPNGTVMEYPWPRAGEISGYRTGIWGVVVWNGGVWATDGDGNALVGVDPGDGSTRVLNTSASAPFPYTLAEAPDGSLWFTSLSSRPVLGRVGLDYSVTAYMVSGLGAEEPLQMQFVKSDDGQLGGYLVALDPGSSRGEGHLYRYSVNADSATVVAVPVGGDFRLFDPDSLSVSDEVIWVAQHGPSSVVSYNVGSDMWTVYPTSRVSYYATTLPYFVESVGSQVWFNEHYGNRIARLDSRLGTLIEYSEANPPVSSADRVQQDLTIAAASNGLWFTSTTGNYIGFVDGSYTPSYSVSVAGANQVSMASGETTTVYVQVEGTWSSALQVSVSDSENYTSVPRLISILPDKTSLPSGSGPASIAVTISLPASGSQVGELPPGRYTVGITLGDGLIAQTVYVYVSAG